MTTYYKGTDADGLSFHKPDDGKKTKYTVGKTVKVSKKHLKDPPVLCSESVLHACDKPSKLLIYSFPQRVFEVEGEPVVADDTKSGFKELKVIREVPEEEQNKLFGWNIVECRNPVNPLKMSPVVTEEDKALLRKWAQVGAQVYCYLGDLFHSPEHPWIHHDLAQLWRRGLVFTEVNGEWQIRGGPKMEALYQIKLEDFKEAKP